MYSLLNSDSELLKMCVYLEPYQYLYFVSGMSQTASFKSTSHLSSHASDISHLPLVSASDCGVKCRHDSDQQYPCVTGTSRLQLQLEFISHLMRIGERLSQLPTKELRGIC